MTSTQAHCDRFYDAYRIDRPTHQPIPILPCDRFTDDELRGLFMVVEAPPIKLAAAAFRDYGVRFYGEKDSNLVSMLWATGQNRPKVDKRVSSVIASSKPKRKKQTKRLTQLVDMRRFYEHLLNGSDYDPS